MTPNEIREKQGRLYTQMTAITIAAKDEKRVLSAEEITKFDAMDVDFTALGEQLKRDEKLIAIAAQMNATSAPDMENIGGREMSADEAKALKTKQSKAFNSFLRLGKENITAEERQTLTALAPRDPQAALTVTTTGGGYIIPQGFEDTLEAAMKWFGGMLTAAETIPTDTGAPLPFPTANDTNNVGEIIGVNTQASLADPGFGQVVIGAYKFSSKIVLVPVELLQDSAFDLNTWIANALGQRLARIENTKFTVGTGTNEPTGIVTAATAAGNVFTMPNGNTAAISAPFMTSLEHSVDKAYRPGSKYMFNDSTLKALKLLLDAQGRPLWLPGFMGSFAQGYPDTVNGYGYIINNDMPVLGTSNYVAAFGDLTKYKIRRVKERIVLRLTERYADYGQVGFLIFERADGNLIDAGTHPVALLRNSAT
jgi:HK97 family phage major capsid protein